jgi:hypothetical protein
VDTCRLEVSNDLNSRMGVVEALGADEESG